MHKKVLSALFVTGLIIAGCFGGRKNLTLKKVSTPYQCRKQAAFTVSNYIKKEHPHVSDPDAYALHLLIQEDNNVDVDKYASRSLRNTVLRCKQHIREAELEEYKVLGAWRNW